MLVEIEFGCFDFFLVEQTDGVVKKVTTELWTAARAVGEPVAVWVGGSQLDTANVVWADAPAMKVAALRASRVGANFIA